MLQISYLCQRLDRSYDLLLLCNGYKKTPDAPGLKVEPLSIGCGLPGIPVLNSNQERLR